MAELSLHFEDPLQKGAVCVTALVEEGSHRGKAAEGYWLAAQKRPVAVIVEISGRRRIYALEPLSDEAQALLGLGVHPSA